MTAEDRFVAKVEAATNGCWIWVGSIRSNDGYGQIRLSQPRRIELTHRWSYEHFIGPIPDGLETDHVCHSLDRACPGRRGCPHRACANPLHLEPVTTQVNLVRGRGVAAKHAAAVSCPQGHEYTPRNTYTSKKGERHCRTCHRDRERERRAA